MISVLLGGSAERRYFINQYRGYCDVLSQLCHVIGGTTQPATLEQQLNIYNTALSLSLSLHVININILNIEIKTEQISNVYQL